MDRSLTHPQDSIDSMSIWIGQHHPTESLRLHIGPKGSALCWQEGSLWIRQRCFITQTHGVEGFKRWRDSEIFHMPLPPLTSPDLDLAMARLAMKHLGRDYWEHLIAPYGSFTTGREGERLLNELLFAVWIRFQIPAFADLHRILRWGLSMGLIKKIRDIGAKDPQEAARFLTNGAHGAEWLERVVGTGQSVHMIYVLANLKETAELLESYCDRAPNLAWYDEERYMIFDCYDELERFMRNSLKHHTAAELLEVLSSDAVRCEIKQIGAFSVVDEGLESIKGLRL